MWCQISQFGIDKAMNTLVEEGIAPAYIMEYHRRQGRKVLRVDKNMGDLAQSRLYDLVDSMGFRWEVKYDRKWHITGNIYLELQALEYSQADLYLIFAGLAYVVTKSALVKAARNYNPVAGGDNNASMGALVSMEHLEQIAEVVIVL